MALLPPRALDRVQDLAKRLKLSGAERERLVSAMKADAALDTWNLMNRSLYVPRFISMGSARCATC
jgi:hypothetical protein